MIRLRGGCFCLRVICFFHTLKHVARVIGGFFLFLPLKCSRDPVAAITEFYCMGRLALMQQNFSEVNPLSTCILIASLVVIRIGATTAEY